LSNSEFKVFIKSDNRLHFGPAVGWGDGAMGRFGMGEAKVIPDDCKFNPFGAPRENCSRGCIFLSTVNLAIIRDA
jgi:hypothetical protein